MSILCKLSRIPIEKIIQNKFLKIGKMKIIKENALKATVY